MPSVALHPFRGSAPKPSVHFLNSFLQSWALLCFWGCAPEPSVHLLARNLTPTLSLHSASLPIFTHGLSGTSNLCLNHPNFLQNHLKHKIYLRAHINRKMGIKSMIIRPITPYTGAQMYTFHAPIIRPLIFFNCNSWIIFFDIIMNHNLYKLVKCING